MTGYIGRGPGEGRASEFSFTATGGQSAFSGLDTYGLTLKYVPGFFQIWINGRKINRANYTATDGSTITFAFGLQAGDVVDIFALSTFSAADGLALSQNLADLPNKSIARDNLAVQYASQAEVELVTTANRVMTPSNMQYHPGVAKVALSITGSTGAKVSGYGGTPNRSAPGLYSVAFDVNFSSASYAALIVSHSGSVVTTAQATSKSASSISFQAYSISGAALADPVTIDIAIFGDQ